MTLFSGMSADKSADASADALCIIILKYLNLWTFIQNWWTDLKPGPISHLFFSRSGGTLLSLVPGLKGRSNFKSHLTSVRGPISYRICFIACRVDDFSKTQTCRQEYASARIIERCRGLQKRKIYHKVEYVQCRVCFVYLLSSLHENVVVFLFVHAW